VNRFGSRLILTQLWLSLPAGRNEDENPRLLRFGVRGLAQAEDAITLSEKGFVPREIRRKVED
jgi:hypothetical protein